MLTSGSNHWGSVCVCVSNSALTKLCTHQRIWFTFFYSPRLSVILRSWNKVKHFLSVSSQNYTAQIMKMPFVDCCCSQIDKRVNVSVNVKFKVKTSVGEKVQNTAGSNLTPEGSFLQGHHFLFYLFSTSICSYSTTAAHIYKNKRLYLDPHKSRQIKSFFYS